jgi:hypothetical protein
VFHPPSFKRRLFYISGARSGDGLRRHVSQTFDSATNRNDEGARAPGTYASNPSAKQRGPSPAVVTAIATMCVACTRSEAMNAERSALPSIHATTTTGIKVRTAVTASLAFVVV